MDLQDTKHIKEKHSPAQVAENIKHIIKQNYKDLSEYARAKGITPTQLYNILNGKEYLSILSAIRFSFDFDINNDYCMKGELPILSPDHDYMVLLGAATDFYDTVIEEDKLREAYDKHRSELTEEQDAYILKELTKARIKKLKSGCALVDIMNAGWAEENPDDDIEKPIIPEQQENENSMSNNINRPTMTLHEAIEIVLRAESRPLTFTETAKLINRQGLYSRKDGKPVPASQISARVKNYPSLFTVDRSVSPSTISLK